MLVVPVHLRRGAVQEGWSLNYAAPGMKRVSAILEVKTEWYIFGTI
jgi:hypothetical protein